ncbi:MAG: DUF1778 domain-containing protein [Bifidobacteriaceae bacterium]|nr:DUF1778 domain-containing protein [Bifidobacteriaceae bacterium]
MKSHRLDARLTPSTDALLDRVAGPLGESRSQFVVRPVEERAERVLAPTDSIVITAAEFDSLLASLNGHGWPAPRLAQAARNPRPYSRS